MPIYSSYSPASEKITVSRTNSSARANSEDSRSDFRSLLSAVSTSAASSAKTDPVKPVSGHRESHKVKKAGGKETQAASDAKEKPVVDKKAKEAEPGLSEENVKTDLADETSDTTTEAVTAENTDEPAGQNVQEETTEVVAEDTEDSNAEMAAELAGELAELGIATEPQAEETTAQEAPEDKKVEKAEVTAPATVVAQTDATLAAGQQIPAAVVQGNTDLQENMDDAATGGVNALSKAQPVVAQETAKAAPGEKTQANEKTQADAGELKKAGGRELKKPEIELEAGEDLVKADVDDALPAEEFGKALEKLAPRETMQGNVAPVQGLAEAKAGQETAAPVQATVLSPREALANNEDQIVTSVVSQATAKGGTMRIRLDPPELGAMQVKVEVRGEMVSATFQTSNDQAARALTHGLEQLKTALEKQGLSVDRLQVQTTRSENESGSSADSGNGSSTAWQGYQNQQDQQRREDLNRMWRRAAYGRDPLDMVA